MVLRILQIRNKFIKKKIPEFIFIIDSLYFYKITKMDLLLILCESSLEITNKKNLKYLIFLANFHVQTSQLNFFSLPQWWVQLIHELHVCGFHSNHLSVKNDVVVLSNCSWICINWEIKIFSKYMLGRKLSRLVIIASARLLLGRH